MKRALLGILVGCITLGFASVTMAGENANAGISIHLTKPSAKVAQCAAFDFNENANDPFTTKGVPCAGGVADFDAWIVVCSGSDSLGVAGVEFGIEYDGADGSGVDINSWRLCGDLDFPQDDWFAAGSGNLVTWVAPENCQIGNTVSNPKRQGNTVVAVAGVLDITVYGQDQLSITPRPVSGRLKVADCLAREDDLTDAAVARGGYATFCSNRDGYNFCRGKGLGETESTWGKIKSQYGSN